MKADWGAFLRERHLLILEWTAEGQSPEQVARALSMDVLQAKLIAMTPEEGTRPHARDAELESGLKVIHTAMRGDEKSSCWPIRAWLDEHDVFNGDLQGAERLVEAVCRTLLIPRCQI